MSRNVVDKSSMFEVAVPYFLLHVQSLTIYEIGISELRELFRWELSVVVNTEYLLDYGHHFQ
jgi:hypothetical protein